jgi:high-affinity K+ transport system ATPase subunit B
VAQWTGLIEAQARSGRRVLALARCAMPAGTTALDIQDIHARFTLLGMVGIIDPPRPEAITAVQQCRAAGVRVIMITGDHPATALWPVEKAPALSAFLATGEAKVTRFTAAHGASRASFPDPRSFLNLNTPDVLATAEELLKGAA